jgi:hypothetical protein
VGVIEVQFHPKTSSVTGGAGAAGERWKIIIENDAVSIVGDTAGGRTGLIGTGYWTGKGIGRRAAAGAPLDDSTWGQIENAVRRALGPPAGVIATPPSTPAPPPAAEAPRAGYTEMIVELSTGDVIYQQHVPSERRPLNGFEWKIVLEDRRVIVYAHDEGAFAYGTWDGERLADREVRSKRQRTVNDYQWGVVERVVSAVLGGPPAPSQPSATASEAPAARPKPPRPPKDRRSGWWALAAIGVAFAGTMLSWRSMSPDDDVALGVTIALAVVTFGLVIYGGYGLGTRCPKCRSWYRRDTTSTDIIGTSTYSKQVETPVYDSSGKRTGTTYETATFERTDYRYHYRCRECSHTWTGTGSSEHRIS